MTEIKTTCCVVGGGPAGMMLGLLLARAGLEVVVLEKHGDFLRDFRGDTVHPSTLELMYELGILNEFLALPHQKVSQLGGQIGTDFVTMADFSYLPTKCKYVAFMPQWDFLDFLADQGKKYLGFSVRMSTKATQLIEENGEITGIVAEGPDGEIRIKADLVVAADGRASILREQAKLPLQDLGAPMDVLWMRLSRLPSDPPQTLGRIQPGVMFVMLNRGDYWQCGYIIAKNALEKLQSEGLESFQKRVVKIVPFTADRVGELKSWDQIKLLTVQVNRLKKWYRKGLLFIGDAAHAMSPVGGVGINLAVQDAVAAANILYKPLSEGNCTEEDLKKVQDRRTFPTVATQDFQVAVQNNVVKPTLEGTTVLGAPWPVKLLNLIPPLRGIPAAVIGNGFRPEHIRSPEKK
ncbi:MAG: FAD-dependent oxidoreductase [Candidatus Obscuribacterales bacterium]|nr:FAD-dependent oxidoreductase [Candidatus Obscuribacterales bacterium]